MEKAIATKKKKVSNFVPDDLVHLILSKLPLKSLKRFGVVRKSLTWDVLFKNSHFMSMYRHKFLSSNHSYYEDATLLLHVNKAVNADHRFYHCKIELYMLSGKRFQTKSQIDWPNPFQDDHPGFFILGSGCINGILCLYRYFRENKKIVFWNPTTTEKFKIIPSSPIESVSYHDELNGFGYDLLKHDYKVIRYITIYNDNIAESSGGRSYETFWEIYSLQSNSWKKLDINMPTCCGDLEGVRVYMDGVCHWLDLGKTYDDEEYLVSFNISSEMFVTTHITLDMDAGLNIRFSHKHLVVLNGHIAIISNYSEMTTFNISILGEIGANDSWTKLFIVGPLPCVEHPIGAWKNGNIFFRKKNSELVWFDISTQKIEDLGLKSQERFGNIVNYRESHCLIE